MKIKNRDQFNDLPRELTIEILSRLSVRTILKSKCVCKSWRDIVKSSHFAQSHARHAALSSARLPAIQDLKFLITDTNDVLGFIEDDEAIQKPLNGLVLSHIWQTPNKPYIHSSINGLLFMCNRGTRQFICNPITREYVMFEMGFEYDWNEYSIGFGVSKSGKYKIVGVNEYKHMYQVYTVGTGQLKSIPIKTQLEDDMQLEAIYDTQIEVVLVNGNLHWLVYDYNITLPILHNLSVTCIDLETELFTSFSCPNGVASGFCTISILGGRLCFTKDADEIEIWCMKEYGNDKSWTKDYLIKTLLYRSNYSKFYPILSFEDGGILLTLDQFAQQFYYTNSTKTTQEINKELSRCDNIVIYSPNFVSLESFVMDNMTVHSF